MSFDWKKFIEFAEELHQQKSEEAFRTAISRAYYSVFCTLRNLKGFEKYTKSDVHSKVIGTLRTSQDKDEQWIGKTLDSLRKERNLADYNGEKLVDEETSQRCILKAEEIFKYLGKSS